MMLVAAGAVDVTSYFHLRLAADGTDATGLTIANIDLQYTRSAATPAAKVDATALAAANTAHTDNYAFEIDATDQPGVYRVDWPDAAFVAGVDEVILTVKCATVFTESLRARIMSATRGLVGTALPAAAADAAGGLPISDAGGLDLDAKLANTNEVTAARMAALTDWINGGRLDLILDIIAADTTTDIPALIATLQTAADAILLDTAEIGAAGAGLTNINLPNQTMDITGNITGNLSGSVGSVTGAVGSVTGAVGSVTGAVGSVTGAVGSVASGGIAAASFAANAITSTVLANDAITAAKLAADVTTELQTGLATAASIAALNNLSAAQVNTEADTAISDAALATAANLATVAGYLDTEIGAIKAKTDNLPASPANETTLTTIAGYLDTEVAAIKAKTDSLTFTSAGFVDANVQKVNDVTLVGDGAGTPWGP